jgi:hypothetical protein
MGRNSADWRSDPRPWPPLPAAGSRRERRGRATSRLQADALPLLRAETISRPAAREVAGLLVARRRRWRRAGEGGRAAAGARAGHIAAVGISERKTVAGSAAAAGAGLAGAIRTVRGRGAGPEDRLLVLREDRVRRSLRARRFRRQDVLQELIGHAISIRHSACRRYERQTDNCQDTRCQKSSRSHSCLPSD